MKNTTLTLHHLTSDELRVTGVVNKVPTYAETVALIADSASRLAQIFEETGLETFKVYEGNVADGWDTLVPASETILKDIQEIMELNTTPIQ